MALAINIRADNASAAEIERLWDQVAAFEDGASMRTLGYRPHLTFAIYDSTDIDERAVCDVMQRATMDHARLQRRHRPRALPAALPARRLDAALYAWHADRGSPAR